MKLPEDYGIPAFVAQRIEHLTTDQKVGGSSPSKRTDYSRITMAKEKLITIAKREKRIMKLIVLSIKKLFQLVGLEIYRKGLDGSENWSWFRNHIYQQADGILHIGAHYGQEAERYYKSGSRVIWFEGMPDVFETLSHRIKIYPNQTAILAVLGDSNRLVNFNVTDNQGQSSSVFSLAKGHRFPTKIVSEISLQMKRLDDILTPLDLADFSHWVVDVQGAELIVLQGAGELLTNCYTLEVEVSTYETYTGGARFEELDSFLRERGFLPLWEFAKNSHGNLLYVRSRQPVINQGRK
jgi:FkbM family methyltransferase